MQIELKVRDFETYLRSHSINYSEKTIYYYSRMVGCFLKYLDGREPTQALFDQYVISLRAKHSPNTLVPYSCALRVYIVHYCKLDLRVKIPKMRDSENGRLSLPWDMAQKIIGEARKFGDPAYTMVKMYFGVGLRFFECSEMKKANIDLAAKRIKIDGKGDRVRYIPLTDDLVDDIKMYLARRAQPKEGFEDYLFIGPTGENVKLCWYNKWLKRFAAQAGVPYAVSSHSGRKTFIRYMLDNGATANDVSPITGNSPETIMQNYDKPVPDATLNKFLKIMQPVQPSIPQLSPSSANDDIYKKKLAEEWLSGKIDLNTFVSVGTLFEKHERQNETRDPSIA